MKRNRWLQAALALLLVAAAARFLLHVANMPPYAGMDEIFHVARLDFVAREQRNPSAAEPSIAAYLEESVRQKAGVTPAFGIIGPDWSARVAAGMPTPSDRAVPRVSSYGMANYEAQQPSLYYTLAAPLASLVAPTEFQQLRMWRLFSVLLGLTVIACVTIIGMRLFGAAGLVAGILLASMPTWLTLVLRAGNDPFACAALAVAVALTVLEPKRTSGSVFEGVAWGIAFAAKLYTWPAAFALPFLWRMQGASKRRIAIVVAGGTIGVVATVIDLANRTSSALGLFAFDAPATTPAVHAQPDFVEMLKITIATAVWTSGQHWNAMTRLGMILFAGPLLVAIVVGIVQALRGRVDRRLLGAVAAAILLMVAGQILSAVAYTRHAPGGGTLLPVGGKEGWYYFALAPLLFGIAVSAAFTQLVKPRWIVPVVVLWCLLWDVRIHEGALYRDWQGLTTPQRPSVFFRWGPVLPEQKAAIAGRDYRVGPLADFGAMFRLIHLAGAVSVLALAKRRRSDMSS